MSPAVPGVFITLLTNTFKFVHIFHNKPPLHSAQMGLAKNLHNLIINLSLPGQVVMKTEKDDFFRPTVFLVVLDSKKSSELSNFWCTVSAFRIRFFCLPRTKHPFICWVGFLKRCIFRIPLQ